MSRKDKVRSLYAKGIKTVDIADHLGISIGKVNYDLYYDKDLLPVREKDDLIPQEIVIRIKTLAQFDDYSLAEIAHEVGLPPMKVEKLLRC
tara:strand:- start:19715 stop:19987 length:273 start_codon:yes stop_codon:yes gene_type:complete